MFFISGGFQFCKKKERKFTPHKWPFYDHFWPFPTSYIEVFHKTEVQTVILRCLVCLNLNWIKSDNIILVKNFFFFHTWKCIILAQYAEARCYPQKRWIAFDFKFKKFSIKQAIFISEIFYPPVKAPKQKKFEVFFAVFKGFLRFLLVFALFSKFEIIKTFLNNEISTFCLWHYFLLQSFSYKCFCSHAKNSAIFTCEQKNL